MVIEARLGLFRDRILVDGEDAPLRRERGGWTSVPGDASRARGRVRYDGLRDRIRIEHPQGSVDLRFIGSRTTFAWQRRRYHVTSNPGGHIAITEGERPAATGRFTASGMRLGYVSPELAPIARELVIGLSRRALAVWVAATR